MGDTKSANPAFVVKDLFHNGELIEPELLKASESVHRQLRPLLPKGDDYVNRIKRICKNGTANMCVALETPAKGAAAEVRGLAVYRSYENTVSGTRVYVDDLVTDEKLRSKGVGHAIIAFVKAYARRVGATSLELDSGTHRHQAHKFYFREGFHIQCYMFTSPLDELPLSK